MSTIDRGAEVIGFDYKHRCKGDDFNQVLRGVLTPGIYEGGTLTKYAATTVTIAPFRAVVNVSTDKVITLRTQVAFNWIVTESKPILYVTYTWSDTIENWADFGTRAVTDSPVTNEVIIGRALFTAGEISGFSYEDRESPPSLVGHASKVIRVKADESGLEPDYDREYGEEAEIELNYNTSIEEGLLDESTVAIFPASGEPECKFEFMAKDEGLPKTFIFSYAMESGSAGNVKLDMDIYLEGSLLASRTETLDPPDDTSRDVLVSSSLYISASEITTDEDDIVIKLSRDNTVGSNHPSGFQLINLFIT